MAKYREVVTFFLGAFPKVILQCCYFRSAGLSNHCTVGAAAIWFVERFCNKINSASSSTANWWTCFFSSACPPTIVLGCTCSIWLFDTSHFLKRVEWGWVISVNCIWRKFLFVDNGWIRLSLSNLTSWQLSLPHSSWQSMTFVNYLLQKFPSWLTQLLFVQHNLLFQLIICGHWTALFARHKFYLPKLVDQDWIFSFNSTNS